MTTTARRVTPGAPSPADVAPHAPLARGRPVRANGVELFCETFGAPEAPPVLLLMGNSAPGIVWPDAFCRDLAGRGRYVIRFDQRDTGWSTALDFDVAPYTLDDLARDALGVLDALGIPRAHLVGLSQGGELAYRLALAAPDRVLSVTALMSSPNLGPKNAAFAGAPPTPGALPAPTAEYVAAVVALNASPPATADETAVRFVDNFRLAAGTASPFDEAAWHTLGQRVAARSVRPDGRPTAVANHSNHRRAQMATPPLAAADLARLAVPVLVLHGGGDPIFPPAHARYAAATIPGARLVLLDAMGHALDPAFFALVLDALATVGAAGTPAGDAGGHLR